MACALRVSLFVLLQFSASVHASTTQIDDAFAMLQSTREILAGQKPKDDMMLLTKSSVVRHSSQVEGARERLAATQNMERSMESAVTKIITGQAGAPSPEFFESIDREMDLLIAELFGEKDGFQLQINNANANVATCNTNREAKSSQLNATDSYKETADLLKIEHDTCRVAESSAYDAKTTSCDLLATKTESTSNAAPQCNCPLSDVDTSAVLTCLASNRNWVDTHKNDLTTQKSDCDTKTQTWNSEAARCDTLQSNYEVAVCIYDEKLEDMCSTLDTCYNQAISARTFVVESVMVEEEHLRAMIASAKKIVCFLNILKQMDTQSFTMSDLEVCKNLNVSTDTTYLNKSVLDVDITYTPADAKAACQTLSSTPGDGQWATAEYAGYTTAWLLDTPVCPHKTTTTTTTAAPITTTTTTTEAPATTTEVCVLEALGYLSSVSQMQDAGWIFDMEYPNMGNPTVAQSCSPSKWHGFSGQGTVGTLRATLSVSGRATLSFGNCWNDGVVKVRLNGNEIASAAANSQKSVTFSFLQGSELEISEENGNAVIQLNDISFTCFQAIEYENGYFKLPEGTTCPAGHEIRTSAGCEAALASLGITGLSDIIVTPNPDVPEYCSVREAPRVNPAGHFGTSTGSTGRGDLSPVCYQYQAVFDDVNGYFKLPEGTTCPASTDILTSAGCEAALASLGITGLSDIIVTPNPDVPEYCSVREAPRVNPAGHFGTSTGSTGRGDLSPVCYQYQAVFDDVNGYFKLPEGTTCPASTDILTSAGCEAALASLGITGLSAIIVTPNPDVPEYCSVREAPRANPAGHFGTSSGSTGRADLAPVCYPPQASP